MQKIRSLILFISLLAIISSVTAKDDAYKFWQSPRDYEPVVLMVANVPGLNDLPVDELFIYRYDAATDSWQQIPYQVDKYNGKGTFRAPQVGEKIYEQDQCIIMARDLGDPAPNGTTWIDDADSRQFERLEIRLDDASTGRSGYAYIYRSRTLQHVENISDYHMHYAPDKGGVAADTIEANSYVQAHNSQGIPVVWKLEKGQKLDVLDKQKLFVHIYYSVFSFPIDETLLERTENTTVDTVIVRAGPLRIFRQIRWTIDLRLSLFPPVKIPFTQVFYPYSMNGIAPQLKAVENSRVAVIRQTFDLNANATGMKFYNPYNTDGILIDGQGGNEIADNRIDLVPAVNWYQITGDQGTYSYCFRMEEIGTARSLYYQDRPYDKDTGEDMMQYGEVGVEISSDTGSVDLNLSYRITFSGANKSFAFGDSIGQAFRYPLLATSNLQAYLPVIAVSLPDTSGPQLAHIRVPIRVDDVTGLNITAVSMDFSFDIDVLAYTGVSLAGTIAASWADIQVVEDESVIHISMSGSEPLAGQGVLLYVELDIIGPDQMSSDLILSNVIFNNGTPNAQPGSSTFIVSGVVPVELASFQHTIENGHVVLMWNTISESNNYGFEVQRRSITSTEWQSIGFVPGNGTSNVPHSYRFIDTNSDRGTYSYRLRQIDTDGSSTFTDEIIVALTVPMQFSLEQNYPNPFNPVTTIAFQIPGTASDRVVVELIIYNLLGSRVRTLVADTRSPGRYTVHWDGRNDSGKIESTGIYIYRLKAGSRVAMRRMVLMK